MSKDYGGSCNGRVNYKAPYPGGISKSGPKDTSGGADLGPNATNAVGPKFSNKMLSPNSEAASATNKASR